MPDPNSFTVGDEANKYILQLALIKGVSEHDALEFIIFLVKKHNPITYKETIK